MSGLLCPAGLGIDPGGPGPPGLDLRGAYSPGPSDGAQESSHLSLRKGAVGRGSFVTLH